MLCQPTGFIEKLTTKFILFVTYNASSAPGPAMPPLHNLIRTNRDQTIGQINYCVCKNGYHNNFLLCHFRHLYLIVAKLGRAPWTGEKLFFSSSFPNIARSPTIWPPTRQVRATNLKNRSPPFKKPEPDRRLNLKYDDGTERQVVLTLEEYNEYVRNGTIPEQYK